MDWRSRARADGGDRVYEPRLDDSHEAHADQAWAGNDGHMSIVWLLSIVGICVLCSPSLGLCQEVGLLEVADVGAVCGIASGGIAKGAADMIMCWNKSTMPADDERPDLLDDSVCKNGPLPGPDICGSCTLL